MSENYEVITTAVALEGQGEVEQVVLEDRGEIGLVHALEGDTGHPVCCHLIITGTMQRLGF